MKTLTKSAIYSTSILLISMISSIVVATSAHAISDKEVAKIVQEIRAEGIYGTGDYGHYHQVGIGGFTKSTDGGVIIIENDKGATVVSKVNDGIILK